MMTDDEIAAEQAKIREQAESAHIRDLLHPSNYIDKDVRDARMDICRDCDRMIKATTTCKECGCFMAAKTWLSAASCPIGRWGAA